MLDPDGVLMLAADHRWQLEEWCDGHHVDRARIPEAKALVLDGFLRARGQSAAVRRRGAMLLDAQYARPQIDRARSLGIEVGAPAEAAGAFPLRWATEPMSEALAGRFVKVLVRHRPDYDEAIVAGQIAKLLELGAWCRSEGQALVLEVLVPRAGEPEDAFEATGRATIVAAYIRRAYAAGVVPDFWKMEGTTSGAAAREVDDAIAERPRARFLVLGKGAGLDLLARWFDAAKTMRTASGFAVGRSIYMSAATDWLLGAITRDRAERHIADTYLELARLWDAGA